MSEDSPQYGPSAFRRTKTPTYQDEQGRRRRGHREKVDVSPEGLKRELEAARQEITALKNTVEGMTIEGLPGSGPNGISYAPPASSGGATGEEITGVTLVINGTGYEDCTLIGTLGTEI